MNPIREEFRQNGQRVLDRLVDGELTDAERRELLSSLDDEPSGWRQCALAFLEAQAWRGDLNFFKAEPEPVTTLPAKTVPLTSRSHRFQSWRLGLAMAASLLVAFGVGLKLQQWNLFSGAVPANPGKSLSADQRQPQPGVEVATEERPGQPPTAWRTVKLGIDDGVSGSREDIDLPVMDVSNIDAEWLQSQRSALPKQVLEELKRSGHQVRQQQQLFPVRLKNGRQLIVPVEQIDVQYVGRRGYQ